MVLFTATPFPLEANPTAHSKYMYIVHVLGFLVSWETCQLKEWTSYRLSRGVVIKLK